ncbi:Ribosome-recycling factor, mitochondrial [Hanseniaspora uvarum DSM 2768]|uniref:Ribosome-recycling factor, mitochondrial n=1 Tax=Hanseniaspora uvarum TaxID=29833 RepID=A0A1E5RXR7_HANUV|nr:hypothetical protein FOG48_00202 [Hanseniaspora uvarum]KAF0278296.1 hypothetical protein FOG50_00862 [Hanseniaspora uvarum]KKA03525.1 Ribosome-recycling factor, mitochondrial [Hanseniaspora uvarum DSM 2768]OEJ91724.1 Ribosome-recycling factor, mitochondrial [Hanseniaspora uvarum]
MFAGRLRLTSNLYKIQPRFLAMPISKQNIRLFSASPAILKKASKGSKNEKSSKGSKNSKNDEEVVELFDESHYLELSKTFESQGYKKFENLIEKRKGSLQADPKALELIKVENKQLRDIATATKKGNTLIISCFDKKDVNSVITAFLQNFETLKLTPQKIADSEQQLKCIIPPLVQATKADFNKSIKKDYETIFADTKKKYLDHKDLAVVKYHCKRNDSNAKSLMKVIDGYVSTINENFKKLLKKSSFQ